MKKFINYLAISDLHLGNPRNPTENIIYNLDEYFKVNHKLFKDLDIIFLVGDEFDRLVQNGSNNFKVIIKWLTRLVLYCKANKIKLRCLEGTASHSYRQMAILETIIEDLNIEIDFKYFDTVFIEHMKDLDLNILYVPDEVNHDSNITLKQIKDLIKEKGLSKVDITMLHGQFHYQLPILLESSHNEEEFLKFTKYFISSGHIHTASIYDRILCQGSFDRLTHGEEEDKGGFYISIAKDERYESTYKFIPNINAMVFKSIETSSTDLKELLNYIKRETNGIKVNSYIRIVIDKNNPLSKLTNEIKKAFPEFKISFKIKDNSINDNDNKTNSLLGNPEISIIEITKNNIVSLLEQELLIKYDSFTTNDIINELKEIY